MPRGLSFVHRRCSVPTSSPSPGVDTPKDACGSLQPLSSFYFRSRRPDRMSSGLRPRPCIKEAEKIRNGMTLMYLNLTFVKHVTDEETLHRLGRTWYRRARRVIVRPPYLT